jgi:hypothetical protein
MLENTKKGQSRENMAHTTKKNITKYVLDTTTQKHTNNVIMFGSFLSPVVCRRAHAMMTLFVCFCVVVSSTYCVMFFFVVCV